MKISELIIEKVESGQISNDELVQICELAGDYLNLKSYNGVKKTRKIIILFGQKFVIDND